MNNPDVGNLKKAFARQRAKDLAERAKLLINKDNEINNLKKEVEETRHNGYNEVCIFISVQTVGSLVPIHHFNLPSFYYFQLEWLCRRTGENSSSNIKRTSFTGKANFLKN